MRRNEFIETLKENLERNGVRDTGDIIEEYEEHFTFKLADGYSEEEIAAKLGDPKAIAAQYAPSPAESKKKNKALVAIGIGVLDFFFGIFCILLFAWAIIVAALTLAFSATSVCMFMGGNIAGASLPEMPYYCACIFGVMFIALAVLSAVGTVFFFGFMCQLVRSYGRFVKNTLGKTALPPVTVYPQFSAKVKRTMRSIALISVTAFALLLIVGFAVSALSAGSFEFWHVWDWFDYNA